MNAHSIAIFGCGDFLRLQADSLKSSKTVRVAALYDPDQTRAQKFGKPFDSCVVADPDTIFADKSIDLVALFVPPWVRKGLFLIAADAGKHIIATKLFGSTTADCQEMSAAAARTGIKVGVIYGRTGDPFMEAAKDLFASGRLGRLALYKQDWIHAYPQWNNWATDPEKNGGPFMDAMIHNLNAACYLMDRPVGRTAFFSDRLAHPDLKCADTDMMTKVNKPTPGIFRGMACAAFFLALWTNLPADPHSATSRVFFDDFSYRGPDELEAHGWTVRTKPGWPGIENASWKKEGVSFPTDPTKPGNRILRMTSSTDGTPAHTAQTQICQQRKFKEDIDWVYFEKDSVLSPEQVEQKVQALRQAGTPRQDTVEATGLPCPCNS